MKRLKFAFTLLFTLVAVSVNAQQTRLYTHVMKLDKFNDIVWEKKIKTLVTKTDSTFIVETKGQKPVEYGYLDQIYWVAHNGSKDSIVNLTNNLYGFESEYIAITKEAKEEAQKEALEEINNKPDSQRTEDYIKLLTEYKIATKIEKLPTITHRTISKFRYLYEYDTDLFWINFPDDSRIVYLNKPYF